MKDKLKLMAAFICTLAIFTACDKDDEIVSEEHTHEGVTQRMITLGELEKNPEAMAIVDRIRNRDASAHDDRNVYDATYDFFINTDKILFIENGNYHSYTFPVYRLGEDRRVENLLISKTENGYTAALYEYDLTEQNRIDLLADRPTLITRKIKRTPLEHFDTGQVMERIIQIFFTETVVDDCSEHKHDSSNFDKWYECTANVRPQIYTITRSVLVEVDDDGSSGILPGADYSSGSGGGGGAGQYNPNVPPFNPDTDFQQDGLHITRPLLTVASKEQKFYNSLDDNPNDGYKSILQALMADEEIRLPILEYLYPNFLDAAQNNATNILTAIRDQLIDKEFAIEVLNFAIDNPAEGQQVCDYLEENEFDEESQIFIDEAIKISEELEINAMEVWEDLQDYRVQMSEEELQIFDSMLKHRQLAYLAAAQRAVDLTNEYFPPTITEPCTLHNGKGDAFRHALWNGMATMYLGAELTEDLTTAHENRPPGYTYSYKEKEMDLYNNQRGRNVAAYSYPHNIIDNVFEWYQDGNLKYLTNLNTGGGNCNATASSTLVFTNQ